MDVWKPSRERKEEKDWNHGSPVMLSLRSKINKLTKDNFEKLSREIFQLEIDSAETMQGLVELLFKNMVMDVTFGVYMANYLKG